MMCMAQPIHSPCISVLCCFARPTWWGPQYLKPDCNHSLPLSGINKWLNSLMFPCDSFTPVVRPPPPTSVNVGFSNWRRRMPISSSHTPWRFLPLPPWAHYVPGWVTSQMRWTVGLFSWMIIQQTWSIIRWSELMHRILSARFSVIRLAAPSRTYFLNLSNL